MGIRTERLSLTAESFASERRKNVEDFIQRLSAATRQAALRIGLPGWFDLLVEEAEKLFNIALRQETDVESQLIDDMRATFIKELQTTLEKTKRSDNPSAQAETLSRWIATASLNAAVEAAAISDDDPDVGVEWVTMSDSNVRASHRDVSGQAVPTGTPFTVDGEELFYPGQPVGDPSVWINCRCVLRPAMLNQGSFTVENFANKSDPGVGENETPDAAVVVLLPRASDPITEIASGDHPHCTLLYLGESDTDLTELREVVETAALSVTELWTDGVSGRATLGKDEADVLLLDASGSSLIRDVLLESPVVQELMAMQEQFPTWIPHVTLGYPDAPALDGKIPDGVTYDRIAIWRGNETYEYAFESGEEDKTLSVTASAEENYEEESAEVSVLAEAFQDQLVPWHGVIVVEGLQSGDTYGRMFEKGALSARPFPLPFKFQPTDQEGHNGSVVCGRIDAAWRGENGMIYAEGFFDASPYAYESIRLLANEMIRGVSVDVTDVVVSALDDDIQVFTRGRIAAATICAIPAFEGAFVALGPWDERPAGTMLDTSPISKAKAADKEDTDEYTVELVNFAGEVIDTQTASSGIEKFDNPPAKTKDGKGWITDPKPTKRITGYWVDGVGAAKIAWGTPGDFNRCRMNLGKYVQNPEWLAGLCANLHYRALGVWPGQQHAGEAITASAGTKTKPVNIIQSDERVLPSAFFENPHLKMATPITVTEEGRVFGHIAAWDQCHIGYEDCVTAPHSETNYAHFTTGVVSTDAGDVAVGQISLGGGHASPNGSLRAAVAHYDATSAAVADVTVGEDEFGIWFSGALRADVTEKQLRALKASGVSGDWRRVATRSGRSNLELVAALSVNVPGFPIPRTQFALDGKNQVSLIASGMLPQSARVEDRPARIDKARKMLRNDRIQSLRASINLIEGR